MHISNLLKNPVSGSLSSVQDSFHIANMMLKIYWVAHGAVNPDVMQLLASSQPLTSQLNEHLVISVWPNYMYISNSR